MSGRSSLPKTVVRFFGNTDFALDAIAHQQVTLVHVSKLNDPFDPYFFFETDFDADYDQLCAYVRTRSTRDADWFERHVPREQRAQSVDVVRRHVEDSRNTSFVLSCSAVTRDTHPKDNLYMWGHYGAGHRGVAIEFDTEKTISFISDQHNHKKSEFRPQDAWMQMEYRADMPPLTRKIFYEFYRWDYEGGEGRTPLHDYLDATTRVKSLVWQREQEWRMLWRNDETHPKIHRLPIPDDAITAVYVGLSASASVGTDIVFETKRKFASAKIFKGFKKHGFALDFRQIED